MELYELRQPAGCHGIKRFVKGPDGMGIQVVIDDRDAVRCWTELNDCGLDKGRVVLFRPLGAHLDIALSGIDVVGEQGHGGPIACIVIILLRDRTGFERQGSQHIAVQDTGTFI